MLDRIKSPQGELLPVGGATSSDIERHAATSSDIANVADDNPEPERDVLADAIERHREIEGPRDDLEWAIDAQTEIITRALADGGVEIWQDGQHGPDDAVVIHVAAHNAAQLARSILYAAGFKSVLIATGTAGGWSDVEDGDTPENFPVPKPRAPQDEADALADRVEAAIKAAQPEPEREAEPEPDWSIGAAGVVIAHQPGIRVYTCATGSVAMRQFDPDHDTGEDPIITVTPQNVPALVKALQNEAKRGGA